MTLSKTPDASTTLADLKPNDTFRFTRLIDGQLMTVVSTSNDAVFVERADGLSPFGAIACKPESLVEPTGA